jgi:MFS family permease
VPAHSLIWSRSISYFAQDRFAVITGLAMAVRIVVASIASPYLGNLADRIDRKKGMILSDAVLAAAMLGLAFFPENNGGAVVIVVFVVQALLGVFQSLFMINFQAAMPLLAPKGNLLPPIPGFRWSIR